jgi:RNA polymerase sigma factor (sigma-70 family)
MSTRSEPGDGRPDPGLSAVMSERRQLINLAYRLLGSLAEAEDAVQETYARWYAMSRQQQDAIESPGAWLTTVASRICLDLLGSARARRERYVGEWIPEPVPEPAEWTGGRPGPTPVDPADRVTLDESINMAFLVVLESMTPAERVAFILHDVFRYPFAHVAEVTGRTPAACRQLASSARRRIRASQAPTTPTVQQAGIVRDFKQAFEAKDIDQRDHPGTHGQRPARPGHPARRHHHDRVRVPPHRRPDHPHLGHTQPRQAPPLDRRLTPRSAPPPSAESMLAAVTVRIDQVTRLPWGPECEKIVM